MKVSTMKHYLVLNLLICEAFAKRDFLVKISRIECNSQSHMINITCTGTKSRRIAGLNMFVRLTDDIYKMRYNLDIRHLNKENQWESLFKFAHLDVCEFLSATFAVPFLLTLRNLMRRFSNFPEKCPIKKDTTYYIQRMKLDPEFFPSYIPEGRFSANGELYEGQIVFMDYKIEIQIVSKENRKINSKNPKFI